MKKHIFCALIVLLCSLSVGAQTTNWRPLLGPAEPASIEQRTPLGIRYISYGFDKPKAKRIAKTIRWMQKRGVPNSLTEEYRQYALKLTENRKVIPTMIDDAFNQMRPLYIACGGKWRDAALNTNLRDLLVKVEAAPVWSPHWNTYAVGLAWGSKNLIQATNVSANGLMSNPTRAGPLRKFSDIMKWEAGNYLAFRAGHKITKIADEKGDQSPCGMQPRTAQSAAAEQRQTSAIQP